MSTTLAPVWMSGQAPNPGDLPSITSDEINATVGLQDIMAQVAACTNPERTLRALENHSSPRNKTGRVPPSQYQAASFGTALAVTVWNEQLSDSSGWVVDGNNPRFGF